MGFSVFSLTILEAYPQVLLLHVFSPIVVLLGELEAKGHSLIPVGEYLPKGGFCDECGGAAWPLLQTLHRCKVCSHLVHHHCVGSLKRRCVGAFLSNFEDDDQYGYFDGSVLFLICPELSLAEQSYVCAECSSEFSSLSSARLCDYTGHSYCSGCHWGGVHPSPARIVHNWDFRPRPMSQAALQYLAMVKTKPLINLSAVAPSLLPVVEEVAMVHRQRQLLLQMKQYLVVCRLAQEEKLLRKLDGRQHFVESSAMYSLQDLLYLHSGSLGTFLGVLLSELQSHITACVLCTAKSFLCEICGDTEILFPFDPHSDFCDDCGATFHKECFRAARCPRCVRIRGRKERSPSE